MNAKEHLWARALAACALVLIPVAQVRAQNGPPPQTVRVDLVRVEPVEQWRPVTGELRPARRALLAAEEEGLIVELGVREGETVAAGSIIASLRDDQARIEVLRTRARAAAASGLIVQREAELAEFRLDLERLKELLERGSAAQTELDRASTLVKSAEAMLVQAQAGLEADQAELAQAERRLSDMRLRAPFDGVVVSRRTELGQWISRGDAVVELVSLTDIEAWIDVPERYIDRLRDESVQVRVRVTALGVEVEAPVTGVVPEVDALSRLFPVRVAMANEDGRLKPGMSVTGMVPTGERGESMLLHKDAIMRDDVGAYVYFAAGMPGEEVAAVARVEVLFAVGAEYVAVRAPQLEHGVRVVVEGNERMGFPGRPLIIQNPPAGGAGGRVDQPG
ncbi:MAG: efflux RND transporter periplasmic adaptor subunit [Phycisphaerales bacterium]|nr:MAG: efflux RND transporter periplasmic adaptor subunit [Phycisphaerales bacterium]